MHPDDAVLLENLAARSDLTVARPQTHYLFLPTRNVPIPAGWYGEIIETPDAGLPFTLALSRSDLPVTAEHVNAHREQFSTLAASLGGLYDGWEATTDVGLAPDDSSVLHIEDLDAEDRSAIETLIPTLRKIGALDSPSALVNLLDAGYPQWVAAALQDPASADDVIHLVGTAAGEQIAAATGLRWVLLVENDVEEIVLADAERGVIRPYSMAAEWWADPASTDVADFIRAGIVLVSHK